LCPATWDANSFVLVGTETAMRETFGSTCHGAGRLMSARSGEAARAADRGRSWRSALAVNQQPSAGAVDVVLLFLGDVVGDVVDDGHAQIAGATPRTRSKTRRAASASTWRLANAKVGRRPHRAEIGARFRESIGAHRELRSER